MLANINTNWKNSDIFPNIFPTPHDGRKMLRYLLNGKLPGLISGKEQGEGEESTFSPNVRQKLLIWWDITYFLLLRKPWQLWKERSWNGLHLQSLKVVFANWSTWSNPGCIWRYGRLGSEYRCFCYWSIIPYPNIWNPGYSKTQTFLFKTLFKFLQCVPLLKNIKAASRHPNG